MSSSQYKVAMDHLASDASGVSRRLTARVTTALYGVFLEQLAQAGEVMIPGLGTLRVFTSNVHREVTLCTSNFRGARKKTRLQVCVQVRVYFSKAPRLRKALKEYYGKVRSGRIDGL